MLSLNLTPVVVNIECFIGFQRRMNILNPQKSLSPFNVYYIWVVEIYPWEDYFIWFMVQVGYQAYV